MNFKHILLNNQNSWITGVWISAVPLDHSIVCYTMLHRVTLVAIHNHGSITLVVPGSRGVWTVDGNLLIVGPQAMSVSVRVRE